MKSSNGEYKGFRYGVKKVSVAQPISLVELVAGELSREAVSIDSSSLDLLDLGAVYVNEERCLSPSRALKPGDEVRIHARPRRFPCPIDLSSRIVSESEDSLLIEKPAGLPPEPTVDNVKENLLSFLEDLRGQRYFLTHRLAQESEGLVLVAKSLEAAARISKAFGDGQVRRVYSAYVEAPVETGSHTLPAPAPAGIEAVNVVVSTCEEQRGLTNVVSEAHHTWLVTGLEGETDVVDLVSSDRAGTVGSGIDLRYRIQLESLRARPKEIRAWLATMGAPVLGDRANGSRVAVVDPRTQKPTFAFVTISLTPPPQHRMDR